MAGAKNTFNFKKSYAKIEDIVRQFESGQTDLEEGLAAFEEGMKEIKALRQYMVTVEHKISELKKQYT